MGFFFGAAFVAVGAEVAVLVDACGLFREGVREMGRGGLKAGRGLVDLGGMLSAWGQVEKGLGTKWWNDARGGRVSRSDRREGRYVAGIWRGGKR